MKVLSLFDGISCARVALDRANIKVNSFYASEIDKYAIEVSKKNYPDIKHIGSVVDVKGEDYKDIELLVGGSPCQDLSIAGKRKGLSGERSGLFYEYVRILKEVKPKYFILENVASMSKEARETITKELFGIEPVMINAALVSAQNRKRLFWVGEYKDFYCKECDNKKVRFVGNNVIHTFCDGIVERDVYKKVEIPQPEDMGILLKDILEENVDEKYYLNESAIKQINRNFGSKGKILNKKDGSLDIKVNTLTSSMGTGGGNVPVVVKNQGKEIGKEIEKSHTLMARDYKGFGNQEMTGILTKRSGGGGEKTGLYEVKAITSSGTFGNRKISKSNKAYCLSANPSSDQQPRIELNNILIRKLTPIERERLQGLPDNYTEGVSNTQRYKQLGNAFNVDVVAHIIIKLTLPSKHLLELLKNYENQ